MQCDRCDFVSVPERVGRHRYNHVHFDTGAFRCSPCSFTFLYDFELRMHQWARHKTPRDPGVEK